MLSGRAWRALVAGPSLMVACVLPAFLVASLASQIELGGRRSAWRSRSST
jgi:hypothetical protein